MKRQLSSKQRGSARHPVALPALLLVDVINTFEFPGADKLLRKALPIARRIRKWKTQLKHRNIPIIYANDNFGLWQADFKKLLQHIRAETRGAPIAELLAPHHDDYFILKPKHSAFHLTPLELLLSNLGVDKLFIAGFQTDMCVMLTAHDAHMRELEVAVPDDCSACERQVDHAWTIDHLKRFLKADCRPAAQQPQVVRA